MPPAADSPDVYLALPARPENVAVVRQSIAGVADALDINHALAADMKIAVTEACTNAVLHAYADDGLEGPLEVTINADDARVTVSVRDRGPGFKPLPAEHDEAPLGFGLALIASLADAFSIQGGSAGTEVQMAFDRDPASGEGQPPGSQLISAPPPPRQDSVTLRLAHGPLVAPVLGRVVSLLAARVDFSIDRLSDAQIVSDAVAQHAAEQTVDGWVGVEIDEDDRALELRVGPLRPGGGDALVAATELPGLGQLLPQLTTGLDVVAEADESELLKLRLAGAEPA
jgi:serine/threonine-protein kinase RsbW